MSGTCVSYYHYYMCIILTCENRFERNCLLKCCPRTLFLSFLINRWRICSPYFESGNMCIDARERIKSLRKVLLTLDVCLHTAVYSFFAKLLTSYMDRYTPRKIERKRHCNTLTEMRLLFDWWFSCLMNYTWLRMCEGCIFRTRKCEWYNFHFFFITFLAKLYCMLELSG